MRLDTIGSLFFSYSLLFLFTRNSFSSLFVISIICHLAEGVTYYDTTESCWKVIITTVNSYHIQAVQICTASLNCRAHKAPALDCALDLITGFLLQKPTVPLQIKLKWRNILQKACSESRSLGPLFSPSCSSSLHLSTSQGLFSSGSHCPLQASYRAATWFTPLEADSYSEVYSRKVPTGPYSVQESVPLLQQSKISDQKVKQIFEKVKCVINFYNSLSSSYVAGFQHSPCLWIKNWKLEIRNCFSYWAWHCSYLCNLPVSYAVR